ncbi:MAG: glycosyltransferase family 4 protein [Glaciimonas sp.]|nr:glycosyltransferase family 4 protein [Glaciimonas sp.]
MRLLIECSFVYENPEINTGIPRVVRNVVARLNQSCEPECVPVIIRGSQLRHVIQLAPIGKPVRWLPRLERILRGVSALCGLMHASLDRKPVLVAHPALRKVWGWSYRILSAPVAIGKQITRLLKQPYLDPGRSVPMQMQSGDVLLLLDAGWLMMDRSLVESCRARGVQVVVLIYDLIPLTHPQFFRGALNHIFCDWFAWIARNADGFMMISATVRDEVRQQVAQYRPASQSDEGPGVPWFDYFHLGTELDRTVASAAVNPAIAALFQERAVYLMVSTIEPRKNHAYLLDAFELLWAAGQDVSLCFIGRNGWKNKALMRRIDNHAELGRKLFMFSDADDGDLEYAYCHARALVFSSVVEGFGLPLVEAMQRGLPSMVSDIPVFREIGQDYAAYFDLTQPQTLADLVQRFESSGLFPAHRSLQGWSWLDWNGATAQLTERILAQCNGGLAADARAVHSQCKN